MVVMLRVPRGAAVMSVLLFVPAVAPAPVIVPVPVPPLIFRLVIIIAVPTVASTSPFTVVPILVVISVTIVIIAVAAALFDIQLAPPGYARMAVMRNLTSKHLRCGRVRLDFLLAQDSEDNNEIVPDLEPLLADR